MASTSAASIQKFFKYDVFLSFRGEDTRKNFVDHLYHALNQRGIITYKDDEKIQKGERISEQLIRSIEESRFYIIVFSKNYASSSWCLEELVKIMECQKTKEQTAYPVFYDVEPTQVRNQSGAVGEAFAKLVGKGKRKRPLMEDVDLENEDDVGRWRNALKDAANLAGMELKTTFNGHEAKCIQQIVEEISLKLHFINSSIDGKLVGMETRVNQVVSSLEIGSDDVRMIGIKGMGGGGKTTLARSVFDYISNSFEGKSFVENVREVSKGSGLKELQKQVLKDVLNDKDIDVTSVSNGKKMIKKMMCGRKALVVLDDVDDTEQLEALAGELTWFKPGSRIIITTRDEQVLVAHGVNRIHNVNLLSGKEAICLFSKYAFKREIPNEGYEDFSGKVVHYADGLPLTIKVLGSFLCGRSECEWEDAIERLKRIPLKETLEKLELSYNALDNDQKEIFLDVVCILKGETKEKAIRMLEGCGYNAQIGLRVLEQKSLISISDYDCLGFHDHIEEMGRNIVRRSHLNEPSRHSRLWIKEEIEDILVKESGTQATRSIRLKFTNVNTTIIMKGLRKMKELRLLYMHDGFREWKVDEVSQYVPDALRSLCLPKYPVLSLISALTDSKVGHVKMGQSNIFQLSKVRESKVLDKLRYLDLSWSNLKTFDLGMTPHLETLNLFACYHFVDVHMPVVCPKLKFLNLTLTKVSNLNLRMTPHLKELNLHNCYYFVELHMLNECPKLKFLDLSGSKVSNLDLGMTPHLEELNLDRCEYLEEIHAPVGCLKKLVYLNLSSCSRFEGFSVDKRNVLPHLDSLAKLELFGKSVDICPLHPNNNLPKFKFECNYAELLPSWSGNLEKLLSFGLCACTNLESFSANISGLRHLREFTLKGSIPEVPKDLGQIQSLEKLCFLWMGEIKHIPDSICMLKHLRSLELKSCWLLEQLPIDIDRLECLEELHIEDCRSLRDIPNSMGKMKSLTHLNLTQCRQVEKLPEELGRLECLEKLDLITCSLIRDIPNSIVKMKSLTYLNLSFCDQVEKLPDELGCLEELHLIKCEALRDIRSICKMKCLKRLHLNQCRQVDKLPQEFGCLECLEELHLIKCEALRDIPKSIGKMKSLKRLNLFCCDQVKKLPEELGCLECLEELHITKCEALRDIPNSIGKMKCLKRLHLNQCRQVEKLPDEFGCLECLEELHLIKCEALRDIPNSICKMKCLKILNLRFCIVVEKLPQELGHLKCLKELNIDGTGISRLPQSIYQLKGLHIYGSMGQLAVESYGFTSMAKIPEDFVSTST